MQNDIIHLNASFKDDSGKEVMVTLNDICFKPFAPENTNCTIYSILSYFQDSYELLNREVKVLFTVASNSSYHIIFCTGLLKKSVSVFSLCIIIAYMCYTYVVKIAICVTLLSMALIMVYRAQRNLVLQ